MLDPTVWVKPLYKRVEKPDFRMYEISGLNLGAFRTGFSRSSSFVLGGSSSLNYWQTLL